jgi:heptosyltransferase-1
VIKRLERWGRWLLASLASLLFGVRRRAVDLPEAPRILVLRLDERIGNLLLLVPLLESLRLRFPAARIELLASVKGLELLAGHPCLDEILPFRKRALFAADGPLRVPLHLRRRRYHVAIDAANPVDPSTTQALLTRFSGARHTVGPDHPGFGRSYSARVRIPDPEAHEIDLRLALLLPVPGVGVSRRVSLPTLPELPERSVVPAFLDGRAAFVALNVGARLAEKTLPVEDYVRIAQLVDRPVVITYGPGERAMAEAISKRASVVLAPPTNLWELAHVLRAADAVITCDTGPMHLAVAVGTPTCGIFVSTDPNRFGYREPPHAVIDGRAGHQDWSELVPWLRQAVPGIA